MSQISDATEVLIVAIFAMNLANLALRFYGAKFYIKDQGSRAKMLAKGNTKLLDQYIRSTEDWKRVSLLKYLLFNQNK